MTELELIHELELRHDGEIDLVNCMQTIKRLNDQSELRKRELDALIAAAEPVVDLFEPRVPREEPQPLVQWLQDTPGWLVEYVQKLARSIPNQVLAFIKWFYPGANLKVVTTGGAGDCTDEKLKKLMEETAPIADRLALFLKLQ